MVEINFLDRIAGPEQVMKDLLIGVMLGEVEVKSMYRQFRAICSGTSLQVHPVVRTKRIPLFMA